MRYYVVIDTNVSISAMLRWESVPGRIMEHAFVGDIIPLLNNQILKEYEEVLNRPKFHFEKGRVETILDGLLKRGVFYRRDWSVQQRKGCLWKGSGSYGNCKPGRAAEILGIFKMDLIELYGEFGIPYIDLTEEFHEEPSSANDMDTLAKEGTDLEAFVMVATERGQNADQYIRKLRDYDRI